MGFIKNFRNLFPRFLTTILVIVIALVAVYFGTSTAGNIWDQLQSFLPILLVAIAAVGLQFHGKSLAAHLVLLITSFLGAGRQFIYVITSFEISSFTFTGTFTLELIISVIIFIYLVLIILSNVLDDQFKVKLESTPVLTAAIIAFIFFFFRSGFTVAVMKILPAIVALLFGSQLFGLVLLLAGVIDVPFDLLDVLFNGNLLAEPISYWIFTAIGIYLVVGAILGILKLRK
ncbi:MAG: hypothetical protein NUK62_04435 [Tenericutes bacterium]|nr:hypothetical protein [Mycoplasmatota bacterium]